MERYLLAYDADCGPCTRFKNVVGFIDAYKSIRFAPLTLADEEGVLDQVPPSLRHRSFHLVSPLGEVLSGADALPTLMSLLPAGGVASKLIVRAPGGLRATSWIYSVLSRLHDSGSCSYKPGGPQRRPTQDTGAYFGAPESRHGMRNGQAPSFRAAVAVAEP